MYKIGFDNDKYLTTQSEHIINRINDFGGKLYLEFGGKLFDDFHASRVLPGFQSDSKIKLLMQLADRVEIVVVISANDIEASKVRSDLGITYDSEVLRLIDAFNEAGLYVGSVAITRFTGQNSAVSFKNHLTNLGVKVYTHYPIPGYPGNLSTIVSENGYGKNDYIETTRPLVVVTGPGPGSGKLATCLSQLYHEHQRGIKAGYAKFETFPIWNLPLSHPINLAYEAATADLSDVNMIDPFHLDAYGLTATNYNRDVEVFPIVNAICERIFGKSPYNSPTDMGVNMVGNCISDDDAVRQASLMEIIRRYYSAMCDQQKGKGSNEAVYRCELLMNQAKISTDERCVVKAALDKAKATGGPAAAIELHDGRIITGKTSSLLGASAAMLINALKEIANISDGLHLLPPIVIEPIQKLKTNQLGNRNPRLHMDEVLIALAISAATNPLAELALRQLSQLKGCEAHSTVMLSQSDDNIFRKININLTCEPVYQTKRLYHK